MRSTTNCENKPDCWLKGIKIHGDYVSDETVEGNVTLARYLQTKGRPISDGLGEREVTVPCFLSDELAITGFGTRAVGYAVIAKSPFTSLQVRLKSPGSRTLRPAKMDVVAFLDADIAVVELHAEIRPSEGDGLVFVISRSKDSIGTDTALCAPLEKTTEYVQNTISEQVKVPIVVTCSHAPNKTDSFGPNAVAIYPDDPAASEIIDDDLDDERNVSVSVCRRTLDFYSKVHAMRFSD
jgi:hypothetical protein